MKKLLLLLSLMVMVVTLVLTPAVFAEKDQITILTWRYQEDSPLWQGIVKNFNKEYPNINLNLVSVADNNYMEQKASAMVAGNIPLDVVWTDSSVTQALGKAGILEPLNPYFKKDHINLKKFFTTSLNDASWNGQIVGWPAVPMVYLIFYNKDLFDKAGVSYPTNNWTMNQFLEKAKKLTNRDQLQYGYNVRPWIGTHDLAYIYAYGGKWFNKSKKAGAVTDSGTEKAYQFIQDLIIKYKVAPTPSTAGQQAGISFDSGKIAMNWSGTWDIRGTETTPSKWGFKWGVVLPPQGPKGQYPIVISNNWSIVSRSKKKELAWKFLKWWNGEKNQIYLAKEGEFPADTAIAQKYAFTHMDQKDRDVVFKAASIGVSRPTDSPVWARTERESQAFRERILLGGNVKDILKQMETNINNIIKENNR
jgi:multiple sugar transport system substrate-binding protein